MCREFLDRRVVTEDARRLIFTDEDTRPCQAERLAAKLAAAQKKRPPRQPSAENTGNAWRITPQSIQNHT